MDAMNQSGQVNTAVVAAAGQATRMWPASKVVPKELFPLGKMPVIAHLVSEFVDAGIRRIILVVSKTSLDLMEALFDASMAPPSKLANDPVIRRFQRILAHAEIKIIPQSGNYGNATPLIQASDLVGDVPCIYAFGDDVIFGENATQGLIDIFDRTGCPVLGVQHVPMSKQGQFGIVECRSENGIQYVTRLLEKPRPNETTSNLAAYGRYLVTSELMQALRGISPGKDSEVWFVDAVIRRLQQGKPVCAVPLSTGRWYTVGDPVSYAEAVAAASAQEQKVDQKDPAALTR
jgi:UTP--glucose-1-phosphate uridylyltransferase